jgi:hypothetical protein
MEGGITARTLTYFGLLVAASVWAKGAPEPGTRTVSGRFAG